MIWETGLHMPARGGVCMIIWQRLYWNELENWTFKFREILNSLIIVRF